MSSGSNALRDAFGAYGSDADSNSDSMSHKSLDIENSDHHETDTAHDESEYPTAKDPDEEDFPKDTGERAGPVESTDSKTPPYVSDEQLEMYEKTKHNLDLLLGCDKVPDFPQLPADVPECSAELQAKFRHWHQLKEQGANFNDALMRNKTFKNPNIYKWLVDHLKLEESGTNMPASGFAPEQLRADFTSKQLAETQEQRAREYAAKKSAESAAGNLRKIDFRSNGYESAPAGSAVQRPAGGGDMRYPSTRFAGSTVSTTQAISQHHPSTQPYADRHGSNNTQQNNKAFEDAINRAKLIAQHLSRTKMQ
ncbi:hypothetical protein GGI07_002067 [Coemansia sp. Benny D115]|nr:hypothetical protein GGI07_002067 [Coemansia sp. Benny D115]